MTTLIASDAAALEEETANPRLRTPRSSSRAKASVGGGSGSSACVVSSDLKPGAPLGSASAARLACVRVWVEILLV